LMKTSIVVALALALPLLSWADVKGTQTLGNNALFTLDSGTVLSSGGDVSWSGTLLTPQGNAVGFKVAGAGAAAFSALTAQTVQNFAGGFNNAANSLAVNDVYAYKTNGGFFGALLVTSVSSSGLTFQYVTFGAGSSTPSGPIVTDVLNNFSYTPAGFGNSGIAPGTLFIVKGTGLAEPKAQAVLQSSAAPGLQTMLNGASAKITSGGVKVTPVFYYAIATQLALVLPSNTPTGTAQITVSFDGQTSDPFSFQVKQSAMGFDTYYGGGRGLGVATNPVTGALYSYDNSIPPGTIVTLWGSGLGADPDRDTTFVGAAFAINSLAHIYVGGVDAPIGYQGASGYPGVNQINITIPANASTGCNVSLVGVTADGTPSNFVTLPIGSGPCSDPSNGPAGAAFSSIGNKSSVNLGAVFVGHGTSYLANGTSTSSDTAGAFFQSASLANGSAQTTANSVSVGSCTVFQSVGSTNVLGNTTGLDAGAVSLKNPAGTSVALSGIPSAPGIYAAQLAAGFITSDGGNFAFHGGGGSAVGAFDTVVPLPTPLLSWTNATSFATVTRSAGLNFTWSGGGSGTSVTMTGGSVSGGASGSFTCSAPDEAGQFTVPPYVLAALPAGTGSISISDTAYSTFTATGLDLGLGLGQVSYSTTTTNFQ